MLDKPQEIKELTIGEHLELDKGEDCISERFSHCALIVSKNDNGKVSVCHSQPGYQDLDYLKGNKNKILIFSAGKLFAWNGFEELRQAILDGESTKFNLEDIETLDCAFINLDSNRFNAHIRNEGNSVRVIIKDISSNETILDEVYGI